MDFDELEKESDFPSDAEQRMIVKACLLAGRLMMENGAETHRVEDTMTRMASAAGMDNSQCFVTPTGIIFSFEGLKPTHFVRIYSRVTDLEKIAKVNRISRELASGDLTAKKTLHLLERIEDGHTYYPKWLQILAAAIISSCFLVMFQGVWTDMLPAFVAGGGGFAVLLLTERVTKVTFVAEFTASLVIATIAITFVRTGYGQDLDIINIASVMPLVPGILITNAVRDLMSGHFFSGLSKGAEAFLTALAIGSGVATALILFS